ncbi:MAG: hypothetical protein IJU03_07095 [Thermoguttaceae bacterium]|nr:hypothetical protein [Thermoguttaceae bacterium]
MSDHVNSLNKLMQTEDETIWNETFSADKIHCADQQTARRFKGYSDNVAELKFDVTPNTSVVAYYSSTGNVNERNQPVELFGAPDTRVLIAWNGKSDSNGVETMIVSTDEECKIGEATAMISVMPLPGKPIAIERANSESFSEAKRIINSRLPKKTENGEGPSAPTHRIVTQIIGSHNIFVLKASDVRDFCEQVKKYVERKYEGRASAWFDPDLLTVIDFYFQNGFRYFAFDLTEVGVLKEKEAIAYTFSSKFAYYPLVINRIGGNNDFSAFDLIIMSPCELTPNGAVTELTPPGKPAYGENQGTLAGGGCVSFSIEDVKRVAPSLNVFDSGTKNVYAYNVTFEKRLNSFTNDFTAIASTKKTTKSSALTSFDSYLKRVQVLPPGKTQNQNVEEKQPSEDDLKLVRVLPSDEELGENAGEKQSSDSAIDQDSSVGLVPSPDASDNDGGDEEIALDANKECESEKTGAESNKTADKDSRQEENAESQPTSDSEAPKHEDPASPSAESENSDGPTPAPVPETELHVTSDPENK